MEEILQKKMRHKILQNKKLLFVLLLLFIAILFTIHQLHIFFIPNPLKEIPPQIHCEKDEDCVPERLCHPADVVNKKYILPQENETGCTMDCRTILDCGRAKPVCRFNQCIIQRWWEW